MHPIGGYFELECARHPDFHSGAVMLNSARNALRYIIRAYYIKEIYAPYYTCPVVWDAIYAENAKIIPYDIDSRFMPMANIPHDAFVLYNNYFGICGKNADALAARFPNLIVDNAQSFYSHKSGMAAFYSPRKFFGLPDGGLAICDHAPDTELKRAVSYDLCSHLLKRVDLGAGGGYVDFQINDSALVGRPVQAMSYLTQAMMGNIDYDFAHRRRMANFEFLHKSLGTHNKLQIDIKPGDTPMVYPFWSDDASLRARLIENQIFVAKYWPAAPSCECMTSALSLAMAESIIPVPIDQRYDTGDMKRILEVINASY